MAEERDPQVSAAYRALGAEEPPRALDDAILAAARRPARSWTRRHAVPLSLAAVLVLSVTVTLRMQHERPDIESIARQEPVASAPAVAPEAALKLKVEEQMKPSADAPARQRAKTEMKDAPRAFSRSTREQDAAPAAAPAPTAPAPAIASSGAAVMQERRDLGRAESSVSGALARQAEERTARDADAAARAPQVGPVQALAKKAEMDTAARSLAAPPPAPVAAAKPAPAMLPPTPEQELERIALLRRDGKHEEADKALAEFRKRYPDYKIPEPMLGRVERR